MFNTLPPPLLGPVTMLMFCVNTLIMCLFLYTFVILKLIVPFSPFRRIISKILMAISTQGMRNNSFLLSSTRDIKWDIEGADQFATNHSYLVLSNHTSWADIFVLQHTFQQRIPLLKFFLKQELIWVPLLGLAWWALDFPFVKRYPPEKIKKNPKLKGKDFETTRRQCEKYKDMPVSVMNFVEGTRFTHEKHQKQGSPYTHLLKPKTGGVATVLSSMGDYLTDVIDVTIVYPGMTCPITFWDLLSGRIRHIKINIKKRPIPPNTAGRNYQDDEQFRTTIKEWINATWSEKDRLISTMQADTDNH